MFSELSYDDFIARVDIQDVLMDAGYHFNRRDGLRYPSYVRLDSDGRHISGDKFLVTPNGKCCFQPPVMKVFNVISFITEHPDFFKDYRPGMDPYLLVNIVCNRILNNPIDRDMRNIIKPHNDSKPFDMKDYYVYQYKKLDIENIKMFSPYFDSRKIDIPTQAAFASSFVLASKKKSANRQYSYRNLSFPLRIPGKTDIVGFEERGKPRLDGSSGYKGKAYGSNSSEGLWIASPNNTSLKDAKNVLWFESAYDAMAYYQLHAPKDKNLGDAVFLSTGGNPTVMQFRGVIKAAPDACHHLCFDNDLAGKQFVMNFDHELHKVKESLPKVSDDMKEYMATLTNPEDYLSGDGDYLPDELRDAYGKYFDESQELWSMKTCGLSYEGDIQEQADKVRELHGEYRKMMFEKLCIGSEQGRLKSLGTYDVPEWALCAMENGDYDGLSDEETKAVNDFIEEHFPEGYVSCVNWDDANDFNVSPAFGTRNSDALVNRGESPFEAVKTYSVTFFHPSQRDGIALPNLSVVREVPADGNKDWNEQLINKELSRTDDIDYEEDKQQAGIDLDADGEIEINESDEKKHHQKIGR